jgi:spermidine synthase
MKKTIVFSILVLGISSVIGQLLVIRELTISFYGNEFFIGWILFSWLFWVGVGAIFLNKIFKNDNWLTKILVLCHILVAVFLPLEIFLSRISRIFISGPTGEIPNLIPTLIYGFFVLAPICLVLGLQFAIFARFFKSLAGKTELEKILGKSYIFEAIGFIVGGLIFSYVFVFFNEFLTVSILAWINLAASFFILFLVKKANLFLKSLTIVLIVVFIGIAILSKDINYQTNVFRFPNQKLVEIKNSLYGNIAVTKTNNQYNFYESGLLTGTSQEGFWNEETAHLPLLFHREPQKILLIGDGINGTLKEILKHQPSKVFYLEIDPLMLDISKKYTSAENRQILDDKRITIINTDTRNYFKKNPNLFDVIIVNLPNPSTALINRFYTEDFFENIKTHLYPRGIFMIKLSLSANYFGPEIKNLDNSIFKAIKNVFPSVLILPEDNHLFIGSLDKIDYDYWPLFSRTITRDIETNFINEAYLKYRLNNDRIKTLLGGLETNRAQINRDQKPIGYYYNFVYWISIFYPKLAKFFQALTNIKFIWIIISFILSLGFLVLFPNGLWTRSGHGSSLSATRAKGPSLNPTRWVGFRKRGNNTKNLIFAMAIAGFSLMAIEIIILFGFQVFYGYLYYKISLIIAFLMAGIALGSWLAFKNLDKAKIGSLIKIHFSIILFSLLMLLGFNFLFNNSIKPSPIIEIIFLFLALIIGALVGFEFPIVNKLYLEQKTLLRSSSYGGWAGVIYGADLFGSCFGAFLISIFILPIFGIYQSLIFLGILNFLILISLIISRPPR